MVQPGNRREEEDQRKEKTAADRKTKRKTRENQKNKKNKNKVWCSRAGALGSGALGGVVCYGYDSNPSVMSFQTPTCAQRPPDVS